MFQNTKRIFVFIFIILFVLFFILFLNFIYKEEGIKEEKKSIENNTTTIKNTSSFYERNWNVSDPVIKAKEAMIREMESRYDFYKYKVYSPWPLASLTKLITALVVIKNINLDTPILISSSTVLRDEGEGGLIVGEVYRASDLLKIMLMASSNRAAVSFEDYLGKEKFLKLASDVIKEVGMTNTEIYESSGLDPRNVGTPYDMVILLEYILEKYPQILTWTRMPSFVSQPLNSTRINRVNNIDPLNERADFLGGKTGTTPQALQNLVAVIQFKNLKLAAVIMGSTDRFKDLDVLLKWIEEAYRFP